MTVYAITDTKKGRTGIAPTYLHTTRPRYALCVARYPSIRVLCSKMFLTYSVLSADAAFRHTMSASL